VQSCSSPPGSWKTSGITINEDPAGTLAEIDARLSRALDLATGRHRVMRPKIPLRERLRRPLSVLFPVILAAFRTAYYVADEPHLSTGYAFVRAAKESINARVAGRVVEIAVWDNLRVKQGQLPVQIDPQPYRIAVVQAEVRRESARLQVDKLKPPGANNWPNSDRQAISWTSTGANMPGGKRSSLTIGRHTTSSTELTRISGLPTTSCIYATIDCQHRCRIIPDRCCYTRTPSTDGSGTTEAVIWGLTGRKETAGRLGRSGCVHEVRPHGEWSCPDAADVRLPE
jgi:Biotin-lipoyl like